MIYAVLFLAFFKVGLFCFGGAFGMLPLIEETVLQHGWLTEQEFYNFVGICESTPGPIAVNIATYVGSTQAGLLGSIAATSSGTFARAPPRRGSMMTTPRPFSWARRMPSRPAW